MLNTLYVNRLKKLIPVENIKILGDEIVNGIIDYDKSVIIETNGKKPKYQLYTRARIHIKN